MMKKTYIKPKATAVEIHQQLLETISGSNIPIGGDGGRPNAAKRSDEFVDVTEENEIFLISW